MKKLLILLTACLALTLTFAACGSDDDDDNGGGSSAATPTTEQTDTGGGAKKPAAGSTTVDIKDIQFVPKDVTIDAGTTIKWTNSDSIAHTVTKDDGPGADFDSGDIDGGGTFEQTFDTKGTINYVCTIHPGQAGTITVK
jgi:plastocyanin